MKRYRIKQSTTISDRIISLAGKEPKKGLIALPYKLNPPVPDLRISRKNLAMYEGIRTIINKFKLVRLDVCPSVVAISTLSFEEDGIRQRNASNYIKEMQKIGILQVFDGHYAYNRNGDKEGYKLNRAKRYIWFPENERKIEAELNRRGIRLMSTKQVKYGKQFSKINTKLIKFASSCRIGKPTEITAEQMSGYIEEKLRERYPLLSYYQSKVMKINAKYDGKPERFIRYFPSIKFSDKDRYCTSIGIRYTNEFCSYTKKDTQDNGLTMSRGRYLNKEGLDLQYDVKGSVPRVARLLSTGKWEGRDYDPYKDIYFEFEPDNPEYEWTVAIRDTIKQGFMFIYFDSTVTAMVAHHKNDCKRGKVRIRQTDKELYEDYSRISEAVTKVCGKSIRSEIFFHESNIYIDVLERLLNDGFDCVTCYDCFYAHKDGVTQEEFEDYMDKLIAEKALAYRQRIKSELK